MYKLTTYLKILYSLCRPIIPIVLLVGIIFGIFYAYGTLFVVNSVPSDTIIMPSINNISNVSNETLNLSNTNIDNSATEVNSIFSRSIGTLIYMLTIALVAMTFILIIKVGCRL